MPISHHVDHERRLVTATATGDVTESDIFGYQKNAWSDPKVAGYDEIVDMTGAARIVEPKAARMRELAALSASMDPPATSARFGIVAPEELAFQLGRIYEAMRCEAAGGSGGKKVMTFRTLEEAENWLGWEGRKRRRP
ncbi:MAG: hypothetical protein AAB074_01525 [Planctomycetota bacterium]